MRTSKSDRLSDPDAHVKLKRLYIELCPEGMTQERFGEVSGIGSQGMVWQFLNGHTPLTVEAAARFAKALGCTIYDISPMLDAAIRADILPVLTMRKKLRRAAVLAFCAALLAPISHNADSAALFSSKSLTFLHILGLWIMRWIGSKVNSFRASLTPRGVNAVRA